jgi:hypothetical protein
VSESANISLLLTTSISAVLMAKTEKQKKKLIRKAAPIEKYGFRIVKNPKKLKIGKIYQIKNKQNTFLCQGYFRQVFR